MEITDAREGMRVIRTDGQYLGMCIGYTDTIAFVDGTSIDLEKYGKGHSVKNLEPIDPLPSEYPIF